MEWSEFVMFVIESVVISELPINENMVLVDHGNVQGPASRQAVSCSKVIPEFNRVFLGVGSSVAIYEPEARSSNWLSDGVRIHLSPKVVLGDSDSKSEDKARIKPDARVGNSLCALDMIYLLQKDVLVVLRSDMCLEFYRFMARCVLMPKGKVYFFKHLFFIPLFLRQIKNIC